MQPTNLCLDRNSIEKVNIYNNWDPREINDVTENSETNFCPDKNYPVAVSNELEELTETSTRSLLKVVENEINDDSKLIKEVSNLVSRIVSQQNKNANIEKIKEQINAVLTRNILQMNNKETGMAPQNPHVEIDTSNNDQENLDKIPNVKAYLKMPEQSENIVS